MVGRNRVLDGLAARGLLKLPDDLSVEGFIAKHVRDGNGDALVLCGGGPRGTLNAVTWYLETACRVGFFWDGERVPRKERIPLEGIDTREEPRWPERQYLISVAYSYSAWWWGWREWRREIEWAVRHRFNIMTCPPGAVVVWHRVWRRFGARVPAKELSGPPYLMFASAHCWRMRPPFPRRFQRAVDRLTRRMLTWGRLLGIRWDSPAMAGVQLPRQLADAWHGQARLIEIPWAGFTMSYLHPLDPRYPEILRAFSEEYRARYGTDHFWWLPSFFEMDVGSGEGPEQQRELKVAIARRTLEAFRAADPQAVLVCLGWTFAVRRFWPTEQVKAFLEAVPDDALRVWDLWEDYRLGSPEVPRPLYEELDYYYGKPWLLGFIHSFAGSTSLHGDLAGAIRRVQAVAEEPRARNCRGMNVQTEVVHHNPLFYDLLSRLAWNPMGVTLEGFLPEYAERRYGAAAAPTMVRCLEELARSVYGTPDITSPLYQLRIQQRMLEPGFRYEREPALLTLAERWEFLPRLARALEISLDASSLLAGDELFEHDLIDIGRQYLGDLFNRRIVGLHQAFCSGDRAAFEDAAGAVAAVLDAQERLLRSSSWFHLQPLLSRARRLPGAPKDYSVRVRDILTIWIGKIPDYARRDYWELLRFCYRPRVDALVGHLRDRLEAGMGTADDAELLQRYSAIEQAFIAGEYEHELPGGPLPNPVLAARAVLQQLP